MTPGKKRYQAYVSTNCDREAAEKCGMTVSAFAKWRQVNKLRAKGRAGRPKIGKN